MKRIKQLNHKIRFYNVIRSVVETQNRISRYAQPNQLLTEGLKINKILATNDRK